MRLLPSSRPSIEDSRRLSKRSNATSSSAARRSHRADAAGGLARTTSRLPLGRRSRRSRIRCLSRRLTLFRITAPPTARLTTKPTRGVPFPGNAEMATRVGRPARFPSLIAALNSSPAACGNDGLAPYTPIARRMRLHRRADCRTNRGDQADSSRGPCGDERRGWRDRRGCACAAGSRGSSRGDGCSAGKYACSRVGSRLEGAPER